MRHREAATLYDAVHWITPTSLARRGSVGWPALIMGGMLIGYPVSTCVAAGSTTGCLRGSVELCVFPVSQGAADRAPCMLLCHSSCCSCCEHSSALIHAFIRWMPEHRVIAVRSKCVPSHSAPHFALSLRLTLCITLRGAADAHMCDRATFAI